MIASALSSRFLPAGVGKLDVAGALAGRPIRLAGALTQPGDVLADAEIVLEGYLGSSTVPEGDGGSLPEFLGYDGRAQSSLPEMVVTAVTHRRRAVLQTIIGPGREQSLILGLAGAVSTALSGDRPHWRVVRDLRLPPAGGGMLLLVMRVSKQSPADDPLPRLVADDIFRAHPFVKTVVAVDEDVDPGSAEDVLWAMTTRTNLGLDCHTSGGFTPLLMDPSQTTAWSADGGSLRTFVDASVPYLMRGEAMRSFR
jgi:4-hydroxy-3-polyprenylbenzoate decarboxylase